MPTKVKGTTGVDKVEAGAVITNPAFSGDATVSGSLTVGGVNVFSGPYRNLIINGDMRIAQRGTSTASITTGGYYTVDRWRLDYGTAGTWTMSQDTDVPTGQGFATSMKWDCTTANASLSAGSAMIINQRIEGQNLQHLKKGTSNAESVTLSFWVKSNKTGTYIAEIYDNDNTRQISKSYTIASADTWEKKTLTFAGDTTGTLGNDNDTSLLVNLWLVAGTNLTSGTLNTSWASSTSANRAVGQVNLADSTSNYINITGVQLEVGEGASDFEFLPYDVQLQRCQRYFWKTFPTSVAPAQNTATGNMLFAGIRADVLAGHDFTVEMRAAPTLISYNPYASNSSFRAYGGADHTVTGIVADTKRIMWINLGSPFTPPNGIHGHITASAEL